MISRLIGGTLLLLALQCKALEQPADEQCLLQVAQTLKVQQRRAAAPPVVDSAPAVRVNDGDEQNVAFDSTQVVDGVQAAAFADESFQEMWRADPSFNRTGPRIKHHHQLEVVSVVDLKHFHTGSSLKPDEQDTWNMSDTVHLMSAIVILLLLDMLVVNKVKTTSFMFHAGLLGLMIVLSLGYLMTVWQARGSKDASAWLLCYVLEIVLSMDNLWILIIIFRTYRIQGDEMRWALTVGLYCAMILRIPLTLWLVHLFRLDDTVYVVIGSILVIAGMMALDNAENGDSVHNMCVVRVVKWCFGSHYQEPWQKDDEPKNVLFYNDAETGEWCVSTLFCVVCMIPFVDLVFAIDSTASKTGDVTNRYLNLSSSLMAIFTLRSMFFIVSSKMDEYIDTLKYGMCGILLFSGVQMMRYEGAQLALHATTLIIVGITLASVAASMLKLVERKGNPDEDSDDGEIALMDDDAEDAAEADDSKNLDSSGGAEKKKKFSKDEAEDKWAVLDTPRKDKGHQDAGWFGSR